MTLVETRELTSISVPVVRGTKLFCSTNQIRENQNTCLNHAGLRLKKIDNCVDANINFFIN
jgi:hypothetical protein